MVIKFVKREYFTNLLARESHLFSTERSRSAAVQIKIRQVLIIEVTSDKFNKHTCYKALSLKVSHPPSKT